MVAYNVVYVCAELKWQRWRWMMIIMMKGWKSIEHGRCITPACYLHFSSSDRTTGDGGGIGTVIGLLFYRVKVVSSNNNAYLRLVVVGAEEELYFVFPLLKLEVVVVVESKKSKIDLLYCKRLKTE